MMMAPKTNTMPNEKEKPPMSSIDERKALVEPFMPVNHMPAPCVWLLRKKIMKQMELQKLESKDPTLAVSSPTSSAKLFLDEGENRRKEAAINRQRLHSRLSRYFDSDQPSQKTSKH